MEGLGGVRWAWPARPRSYGRPWPPRPGWPQGAKHHPTGSWPPPRTAGRRRGVATRRQAPPHGQFAAVAELGHRDRWPQGAKHHPTGRAARALRARRHSADGPDLRPDLSSAGGTSAPRPQAFRRLSPRACLRQHMPTPLCPMVSGSAAARLHTGTVHGMQVRRRWATCIVDYIGIQRRRRRRMPQCVYLQIAARPAISLGGLVVQRRLTWNFWC